MTYRGTVKDGGVVLAGDAQIPDGTEVHVEPVSDPADACAGAESTSSGSLLFRAAERAKSTGISDLAINHNHYLYGHPKVTDG